MRRSIYRVALSLALVTVVLACWAVQVPSVHSQSGPPCPGTICGLTMKCGGEPGFGGTPPGPASLCGSSQEGGSCEMCTGVANVNVCIPGGEGGMRCKSGTTITCGSPLKGKCTKKTAGGATYYYCKKTSGNGSSGCKFTPCDGEEPCP